MPCCNCSDSVTSASCDRETKILKAQKLVHGMRPVAGRKDRSIRSIHLKMFFVEYPVRVISVALLCGSF